VQLPGRLDLRQMPIPVYFEFGEREVSVTHDQARQIAALLTPNTLLHGQIMGRLDDDLDSPITMDSASNEDLLDLRRAIESFKEDGELPSALRFLHRRAVDAIEARGLSD
jgi:hypothetical protein